MQSPLRWNQGILPLDKAEEVLKGSTFALKLGKRKKGDEGLGDEWGTGFFCSEEGMALTAYHNLRLSSRRKSFDALYKGAWIRLKWIPLLSSLRADIAVLQLETPPSDVKIECLTVGFLDPTVPLLNRKRFWAGRVVSIYGYPIRESRQEGVLIDTAIHVGQPLITSRELSSGDDTNLVERLNMQGGSGNDLGGISGAAIFDRQRQVVIGVQGSYDEKIGDIRGTEIAQLVEERVDLKKFFKFIEEDQVLDSASPMSLISPVPAPPDFIGRRREIEQLQTLIRNHHIVMMSGVPGVGKTYLAARVAKELSTEYKVCWIDREGLTLDEFLLQANEFLKSEGERGFTTIYRDQEMENVIKSASLVQLISTQKYTFFIDNFQRANQSQLHVFLKRFSTHAGYSRLVIIDHSPFSFEPSLAPKVKQFPVEGLIYEEAREFIVERSKDFEISEIHWNKDELEQVVTKIERHPLAMDLIIQWRAVGASPTDVLDHLVEYANRSGDEMRHRLLEDIALRLNTEEQEALHRFAVFRTSVQRAAWDYIGIKAAVGESLLKHRLLKPSGPDEFQMHPVIRAFWYENQEDMSPWHEKAAQYYWNWGKSRQTSRQTESLYLQDYLEAHYHLSKIGQDEKAGQIINELIQRLHEREPLISESLPSLKDWLLNLDPSIFMDKPWLLLEKGRKLEREGRREDAESVFREAYSLFKQSEDGLGSCVALYYVAKMLHLQMQKSKVDEALRILNHVREMTADPKIQLRVLSKIVDCNADSGQYNEGLRNATEVEGLAARVNDVFGSALAMYLKAKIKRCESKFAEAEIFLAESEALFKEAGDLYRQSKALSRLGIVQGFQGKFQEAIDNFKRAIDLKKATGDYHGLARDLDYLADIYRHRGLYKEAKSNYEESLKIKQGKDDLQPDIYGQIKAYNNLARLALLTGHLSDAEAHIQNAKHLIDTKNRHQKGVEGTCLINQADLHFIKGESEYKQSIQEYKEAAACFEKPNSRVEHSYARALLGLGQTYVQTRNFNLASTYLEAARAIFNKYGIPYYEALTRVWLARLKAIRGRTKEAALDNQEALAMARRVGAQHIEVLAIETQALIEESCILSHPRMRMLGAEEAKEVTQSFVGQVDLVDRIWKYYDVAIQQAAQIGAELQVRHLKIKKNIWLFTVKFLCGDSVPSDSAFGLLMSDPNARDIIYTELLGIKNSARVLGSIAPQLANRIARVTLGVLSPLAMRSGFNALRDEVDDFAFSFLHPSQRQKIKQSIEGRFPNREPFIRDLKKRLEDSLIGAGIQAIVIPRAKSYYSIYRKHTARHIKLDNILDLVGVRIITQTEEECYKALAIVRNMGSLFVGKEILVEPVRDYIQNPKKTTRYQSIHINIQFNLPETRIVEFQIRTQQMHLAAEIGFSVLGIDQAAHWRYKHVGKYAQPSLEKDYGLSQQKIVTQMIIDCGETDLASIGQGLRKFGGVHIHSIDLDRMATDNYDRDAEKRVVLWLELTMKAHAHKSPDYLQTKLNSIRTELKKERPNCRVWVTGDKEAKPEFKVIRLPNEEKIKDKAKLIHHLSNFLSRQVYVLTPAGDVIGLPAGAIVVDLAYKIHTALGHRCKGARVNGEWVALNYELKTGDRVEIVTKSHEGPNRDWLKMVKTRHARSKIKQWLRQQSR